MPMRWAVSDRSHTALHSLYRKTGQLFQTVASLDDSAGMETSVSSCRLHSTMRKIYMNVKKSISSRQSVWLAQLVHAPTPTLSLAHGRATRETDSQYSGFRYFKVGNRVAKTITSSCLRNCGYLV